MKQQRSLVLSRETLTELTPGELGSVAGGARTYDDCPSHHCYTNGLRCHLSERLHTCPSEDLC